MIATELLQKYDRPVPRYTSYPTAIHFNQVITQERYTKLLGGLSHKEPVSLYVHIPFCHVLCYYCGCHTKVTNGYGPIESYLEVLLKEIDLIGEKLSDRIPVSQLHFGGGSPNLLKADDLKRIMSAFSQYFKFEEDTEIAIETDPRVLDRAIIGDLAQIGVTRVSLGVQDFNADVQKAVNRVQPFEKVRDCTKALRDSGINKINFDLMVGLPLQTVDSVLETVRQAVSLSPDRLSVFAYAHVPWLMKQQKLLEKYPMPDTAERFEMIKNVKDALVSSGYHAIGIDHFARETDSLYKAYKEGTLKRNFQGYTDDKSRNIIGVGQSSISSLDGVYIQNSSNTKEYKKLVEAGQFPIKCGCVLSEEDQRRRALIEQIMCGAEADFSAYPDVGQKLKLLERDNLVQIQGTRVKISSEGWPFARVAAACFDEYYKPQKKQHAKAI